MTHNMQTPHGGADLKHREHFQALTGDSLDWTPALDECLRVFFWLLADRAKDINPMEVLLNYGHCLGISETLNAAGLISDDQCQCLAIHATSCMGQKLLPWNGREFMLTTGFGIPPEGLGLPTLQ